MRGRLEEIDLPKSFAGRLIMAEGAVIYYERFMSRPGLMPDDLYAMAATLTTLAFAIEREDDRLTAAGRESLADVRGRMLGLSDRLVAAAGDCQAN